MNINGVEGERSEKYVIFWGVICKVFDFVMFSSWQTLEYFKLFNYIFEYD